MRLKAQIAAAHTYAIRFDKELTDRRHQQPAQYFQIPVIRLDEIEIVMRVGFAIIQHGIEQVLDVRDIELGLFRQRMSYAIYGLIPAKGVLAAVWRFLSAAPCFSK